MNVIATKENYRNYNFKAGAKVQIDGVDLWDDNGDITAEWAGGTVPDPTTFEDTVTHEAVVTHEVAPVMEAGAQIDGPIYTTGGVVPFVTGAEQKIVASSGAIDLTAECHLIDTDSGALALTIGSPTIPYQKLKFRMINDGGGGTNDATITFNGTATIVFADSADYAEVQHNGADWIPVELINPINGTIPVYTPAA